MPYKDPEKQRQYAREWMARRRKDWFADKTCARCGSNEQLELDHIDESTKVSHRIWSWSNARREEELAKCQPLCHRCHGIKSDSRRPHGQAMGKAAKLTEEQVVHIKSLFHLSGKTITEISRSLSISKQTVSHIVKGRTWKHIENPPVG